ncbi:MAG: acyltransferase family protein [Myxococcota bacterium]
MARAYLDAFAEDTRGRGLRDSADSRMAKASEISDSKALARWRALDLFRLIAVVLMVQGHVFTELLDPAVRAEPWYVHHRSLHGLTAPIFFFSSGLAFGVATIRHWREHIEWGPAVRRRFERYGWLLFIGYGLNLPKLSLRRVLSDATGENARAFLRVDALENIAVSLSILQLLVWLTKVPRRFTWGAFVLATAFVFAAPLAADTDAEGWLPLGFAAYVNSQTGSFFPLFPWTGFIFLGAVAAYLSTTVDGALRRGRAAGFALTGLGCWLLAQGYERAGAAVPVAPDDWQSSPTVFLTRLGLVMMAFAVLCAYESFFRERTNAPRSESPDLVQRLSRETLVIYVVHLVLLYWWPEDVGLSERWAPGLGVVGALLVAAVVFVVSCAAALSWAQVRRRYPHGFRRFQLVSAAALLLISLVKP